LPENLASSGAAGLSAPETINPARTWGCGDVSIIYLIFKAMSFMKMIDFIQPPFLRMTKTVGSIVLSLILLGASFYMTRRLGIPPCWAIVGPTALRLALKWTRKLFRFAMKIAAIALIIYLLTH